MSDFNTDDINDLILKDIAIEECKERIAELEEQNKWISVDERLPEEGQFCAFYCGIIDGEPEIDADFWEASSMTVGYSWQRNVTHWKPITPPEKDDGR